MLSSRAPMAMKSNTARLAQCLVLPGVSGNYASTPDSAANSVTSELDLRVKLALDDWTPSSNQALLNKFDGTPNNSWACWIRSTGLIDFTYSIDGNAQILSTASSAATGFSDGTAHWVRVTFENDNGSGNYEVKFYTSEDGEAWTQLGVTRTGASLGAIIDTASRLTLGAYFSNGTGAPAKGKYYSAEVRNGIDGPIVASFNPNRALIHANQIKAETGEIWTINTSGVNKAYLF